jgi:hypothetical protein
LYFSLRLRQLSDKFASLWRFNFLVSRCFLGLHQGHQGYKRHKGVPTILKNIFQVMNQVTPPLYFPLRLRVFVAIQFFSVKMFFGLHQGYKGHSVFIDTQCFTVDITFPVALSKLYALILQYQIKPVVMGILKQVSEYLYLRKKDPNVQESSWLKKMHGINRISIFMFLICLLVMLFRAIFR